MTRIQENKHPTNTPTLGLSSWPNNQPKLKIGQAGDKYEQEADARDQATQAIGQRRSTLENT